MTRTAAFVRGPWALLATAALLASTPVATSAGGLYIREFGHPAQGTSGAGNESLAEDASTAFTNPSGLFRLEGDSQWMVTGLGVFGSTKFRSEAGTTIPGNDGGDAAGFLPGAALFYTRKLSDDWGFSASLGSISGNALDYGSGFVGRYEGSKVELLTVTATPSIAYRFSERLSVSVGVPIAYGRFDLDAAIPRFIGPPSPATDGKVKVEDGNDLSATIMASLMFQASERLRLGLTYLGENTLDFDGDAQITLPGIGSGVTRGNVATAIEITFPQMLRLGAAYDVDDAFTVVASLGWEDWSSLDKIPVSTSRGGAAIPSNWGDTWSVSAGFRYRPAGRWTYDGGIGYDSSPVGTADRTAILPVDRQWRFSAGATYAIDDERSVGAVLTYLDGGDARIDRTTASGRLIGEYETYRVVFLGINYQWR